MKYETLKNQCFNPPANALFSARRSFFMGHKFSFFITYADILLAGDCIMDEEKKTVYI